MRHQEAEAVLSAAGEARRKHVFPKAETLHRVLHGLGGDIPHTRAAVHHPVHGREADPGRSRDVGSRRPSLLLHVPPPSFEERTSFECATARPCWPASPEPSTARRPPHVARHGTILVWYDGGCPLCRREIALMRRLDRRDAIMFVDIADTNAACPIDRAALLARFHALEGGEMLSGAAALRRCGGPFHGFGRSESWRATPWSWPGWNGSTACSCACGPACSASRHGSIDRWPARPAILTVPRAGRIDYQHWHDNHPVDLRPDQNLRRAATRRSRSVDLDIRRGEIFALLGPNGAGKTTLISIVCGLVDADAAARVIVDGHDIADRLPRRARHDRPGAAGTVHRRVRDGVGYGHLQPRAVRQAAQPRPYREGAARPVAVGQARRQDRARCRAA